MEIWVDADACPNVIKEILFRAAQKTQTKTILVANKPLRVPSSEFICTKIVPSGFDVADDYIEKNMQPGDLVITADIPLADAVISNEGAALNPRGELYTKENIKERLSTRDLLEELRSTGAIMGGPSALKPKDKQAFANQLDRILTQSRRKRSQI